MTESIEIIDDTGKKILVGWIRNKTFFKKVKKSKHYFRKSSSWGIDAHVFSRIIEMECDTIKILDEEENTMYEVDVQTYKQNGNYLHIKPHRAQIFLSVFNFKKYFNYHKK